MFDDDDYDSTEDDNRAFDPDNDRVVEEDSFESAESEENSDRSIENENENQNLRSNNHPKSDAARAEDKESDFTFYD